MTAHEAFFAVNETPDRYMEVVLIEGGQRKVLATMHRPLFRDEPGAVDAWAQDVIQGFVMVFKDLNPGASGFEVTELLRNSDLMPRQPKKNGERVQ